MDCSKFSECANADSKCHICINFNCFKTGASRGKGNRAEKNVTKIRQRKGSGAAAHAKGDLIDSQALYESKSGYTHTDAKGNKSFSLKREWLLKIEKEALQEGRMPILTVKYDQTTDDEVWAVVRAQTLFDLIDRVTELETISSHYKNIYTHKCLWCIGEKAHWCKYPARCETCPQCLTHKE